MTKFTVQQTESLTLETVPPLSEMYTLSPFVWQEGSQWNLLLRAVPRSENAAEKIARIYYGQSEDGLRFVMGNQPVIAPGTEDEDQDGCEDPTAIPFEGFLYVYYSGWNETKKAGKLLLATGPDGEHLTKHGVMLPPTAGYDNPKEATLVQAADRTWRLFFEYANQDASKIGLASAPHVDGPWTVQTPPFEARPDSWDAWHLSAGPIWLGDPNRPVMFYNGATRDAHWRIGWVAFDAEYTRIVARCEEPLIVPPIPMGDDTDIAFAASCVADDSRIYLYYSVADKDLFRTAIGFT